MDEKLTFSRGDVISRKFEVEHLLGHGAFGATYLARHIASGKHLAIKFIRPDLLEDPYALPRFKESFEEIKPLRHPGIVRYGEFNEHNGLHFFTEEYVKGQSLRALLDEYNDAGQAFSLQEACQITIQVLQAIEVAHDKILVHRNLKPENILIQTTRSGPGGSKVVRKVKITDLGIADLYAPDDMLDRLENQAATRYLAPELSSFGSSGTAQADIYSVGVIFYELLTGQPPRGTFLSPTQLRDDLPDHVDDIIELALAGNPEDRYPSAKDMVRDIQRSFQLEWQDDSQPTSFKNILIGIGAFVLLAGLASLYYLANPPVPQHELDVAADNALRKQIQADNPMPSEAEVRAMLRLHKDMVYVPGGTFIRGRLKSEDAKLSARGEPLSQVVEVEPYFIDRFEFPNRKGQIPVGRVSWSQAEAACQENGKRLCTELEWEKACKGPGNLVYSYGDTWDPSFCGEDVDSEYTLGDRAQCVSGYGVFDVSGGFREWTADSRANKPDRRIVKGGARGAAERGTRCAFSVDEDADYADSNLTFRCCVDIDAEGGEATEGEAAEGEAAEEAEEAEATE